MLAPRRDRDRRRGARSTASRAGEPSRCSPRTPSTSSRAGRRATSSSSTAARSRRCSRSARKPRARWRTRLVDERQPALLPHDAARPRARASRPGRPRSARGGRSGCERRRGVGSTASAAAAPGRRHGRPRRGRRAARSRERHPGRGGLESSSRARPERIAPSSGWTESGHRRASRSGRRALVAAHARRARAARRRDQRRRASKPSPSRRDGSASAPSPPARGGPRRRADGIDLRVNGTPVFARGAVWTPVDRRPGAAPRTSCATRSSGARRGDEHACASPAPPPTRAAAFHDLCDELGSCSSGRTSCSRTWTTRSPTRASARPSRPRRADVLARLAGRPSLAVLCGSSEVEQQAAMLGLEPEAGAGRAVRRAPARRRQARPGATPSTSRPPRAAATCRSAPTRRRELLRRRRLPAAR